MPVTASDLVETAGGVVPSAHEVARRLGVEQDKLTYVIENGCRSWPRNTRPLMAMSNPVKRVTQEPGLTAIDMFRRLDVFPRFGSRLNTRRCVLPTWENALAWVTERCFRRWFGWEPLAHITLVTASAALPTASRPVLPSPREGSRDRAASGSCYSFLRCPGFQAARLIGCSAAVALGPATRSWS